jgi:hypothetical protein
LTGTTKYDVWVSGFLTQFFVDFWAIAICINFIPKSLKQPNIVHAHDG